MLCMVPLAAVALADAPLVQSVLDNGLRVVIEEDHRAPAVAVHVQIAAGSAQDPPGLEGLAHLLEHLLYEGSPHAPDGAYDRWIEAAGGDDNAWTGKDYTAFHLVAPVGALDLALFLESDRMGSMWGGIDTDDLANQLDVVAAERSLDEESPGGMDLAALSWALWPEGHPYRWPVLGRPAGLAGVHLDQVLRAHREWQQPSNASLVIVGDVDATDALERVRAWFSDVPGVPMPPRPAIPAVDPQVERRAVHQDAVDTVTLYAAWPTVPRGHPDEPALDLLAEVLASDRGSRMVDRLEGTRVDSVQAWTDNGRLGGSFAVALEDDHGDAARLLRMLDRALEGLRRHPPSVDELQRRQARWRSWTVRATEDLETRAEVLNDCLWSFGQPRCLGLELDRHLAVRPADLLRVADAWLSPQRRVLLSVVPEGQAARALPGSAPVVLP